MQKTNQPQHTDWYVADEIIGRALAIMGQINVYAAPRTKKDLEQAWRHHVFLRLASGSLLPQCAKKFLEHDLRGEIASAIILVQDSPQSSWFRRLLLRASAACFPFEDVRGAHKLARILDGLAILYFGKRVADFEKQFAEVGWVGYVIR